MTDIKAPPFTDLDRDIVLAHVALTGLLSKIPLAPSPIRKDDFGIIVRETPSLEIDAVLLCINRGGISDRLKYMCPLFVDELDALFSKSDTSEQDVLDLITMDSMCRTGQLAVGALARDVWHGTVDSDNRYGFYREFDGLDAQIENVIDFESNGFDNLATAISSVRDELEYIARDTKLKNCIWCYVGVGYLLAVCELGGNTVYDHKVEYEIEDGVLTSDVYILPLSVDEKPALFLEYADYREINAKTDENCFWTDGGLFLWTIHQDNWDFKLKAQIEAAIRLTHPQLAAKISNVSMPLLKDQS